MQPQVTIRPETLDDADAIDAVLLAAFPGDLEARLVKSLRKNQRLVVSLVAEIDGEIIGTIAFSPVVLEPARPDAKGVGLAPVAVKPEHQRIGIGGRLIRAGLEAARESNNTFAIVLGHADYYPKFGFRPASEFSLRCVYGDSPEFMAMELQPHALKDTSGVARYCEDFSLFE